MLVCIQLVEHLPRMQNVVGLNPSEAAHFSKMTHGWVALCCTVMGEILSVAASSIMQSCGARF